MVAEELVVGDVVLAAVGVDDENPAPAEVDDVAAAVLNVEGAPPAVCLDVEYREAVSVLDAVDVGHLRHEVALVAKMGQLPISIAQDKWSCLESGSARADLHANEAEIG